jgi:hypothetical protein
VSDSSGGILQAVLRVSASSDPETIRADVVRGFKRLDRIHPGSTFSLVLTANVVLRHSVSNTFKFYFGQSFGVAKTILSGQRRASDGRSERAYTEYKLSSVQDAREVPVEFRREDFGEIFALNYESSAVVVHSVVNVIFIFGLGLKNYERESTTGNKLTKLW